ncbi:FadR/GntR family transcriptional regulator [Hoeflea prorocentri]|uniref:FCD domain-containing protein n=1 Tax=Hoeflea prorocentri TaxID=1922333 RepID=A0A9X3UJ83_9HYPH|nr:FCD domain-containing protein [Hoeflea prorocentri]MCY6381848.1 FCD domain-containing protein [Hoeflea prorocentri]MDA5399648.1 FCD domain-containing protein [Hoeflea prorocentri]
MTEDRKSARLSAEELKETIADLASEDGTLPPERELVEEFGITRSRLRRILAEMREDNLIPPARVGRRNFRETNPQVQNLVRLANPTDVIELRLIIEPQLARLAALKASSLEAERIVKAANSQKEESYGAPDLAFHLEIASATRNTLARELYRILRQVGGDARVRLPDRAPPCPDRRRKRDAEHLKIARAIAARDPDLAQECMRQHLLAVRAVIFDRMSPDFSAGTSTAAE